MPDVREPSNGALVTSDDCSAVFQPLPSDRGREWCIRQVLDCLPPDQRSFLLYLAYLPQQLFSMLKPVEFIIASAVNKLISEQAPTRSEK